MKKFFYKAIKDKTEYVSGYIEAASHEEARDKVKLMGFLPAGVYEEKAEKHPKKNDTGNRIKKVSLKDLILFTSELHMLTDSGISVLQALDSIAQRAPSLKIAILSRDLSNSIKAGSTFSEALSPYMDTLGHIYYSLCKTGEESGTLPAALKYMENLLKKKQVLNGKLIQMSIYPAILILVLTGMFLLFGGVIFPFMISTMNLDSSPPMVQSIMFGTNFVFKTWWMFILGGFGVWHFFKNSELSGNITRMLKNFFMKIPVLNNCIQYLSLSHYMAVLHISYEAGVPIASSLQLAEETMPNEILQKQAQIVTNEVKSGKSLTDAFYNSNVLPSVMLSMISTGEETGKLGKMFRDISIAVDQKLDSALAVLMRVFEPILLLFIGAGVAVFAIAIIQMYYQALGSLAM